MSGIAGIARRGEQAGVDRMLDRVAHRGGAEREVFQVKGATLGIVRAKAQSRRATGPEQPCRISRRTGAER
jgi:asparagine synthetase B (glutamine-hydrolysing)